MKTVLAIVMTGIAVAGAVIGVFAATGHLTETRAPAVLADACRTFIAAYDEAFARAKKQNDETLQTELAHPVRVGDVWESRNQDALKAAALKVQNFASSGENPDWAGVAWQLVQAATVMNPTYEDGAAQKDTALSAAHAGCIGR